MGVLANGNIRLKKLIHFSQLVLLFNRTEIQWPQAYHSKTPYVLDLKVVYR